MIKISVFTPTHNPQFIDDCYESLCTQTLTDWEWVIFCNGDKVEEVWEDLGQRVKGDARVHVRMSEENLKGIGEIKKLAVVACTSEFIVEYDHDDILLPDALQETYDAFMNNPEVGFVHSNFSQINEDKTPSFERFQDAYGWKNQYRKTGEYLECITMIDHPHNFSRIYFQPNHLRAFRKSIYEKVGGYDKTLDILDDQDLMCRLYIEAPFYHIDRLLYLQRVYPGNSQKRDDLRVKIPSRNEEIYYKYIEPMTLAWAKRNNLLCIDLGAAHRPKEGYISLDLEGAQICADVTNGLPFGDNKVGVIRAVDFLEHIPDKIGIINEIYRSLADGGMLLSMTPSTDGWAAFSDPTHVAFYNERSFWYYIKEAQRRFVPAIKAKFQESYLATEDTSSTYGKNSKHVVANLIAIKTPNRKFGGILEV